MLPPAVLFMLLGFFLVLDARSQTAETSSEGSQPAMNRRGRATCHPPIFTTPASPSTVIRWPLCRRSVATPVPSTAGI